MTPVTAATGGRRAAPGGVNAGRNRIDINIWLGAP